MIVGWITVTLLIAVVLAFIFAMTGDEWSRGVTFFMTFFWVCSISFWIGVIYVASHFISKYW